MALSQLEMTFTTFLFDRWNQRICPSQNDDDVGWNRSDPLCTTCLRSRQSYHTLGIVFVTRVIYHWNQRVSESQNDVSWNRTTPGLPRSGICFYLRTFASEIMANYAKV
ncbi:hypothetical protein PROFUN_13934 [Planoprotostelium fungivorum]|uniref:Uncharacterized protein n=1 Tax=Planoprotostelium fungivorum TaxID=1890364 RepID=A0A2P6N2I2_9EUKA|nr:hypothetical protein PROFUN_13934 [Planoprotostelium fungivorum]